MNNLDICIRNLQAAQDFAVRGSMEKLSQMLEKLPQMLLESISLYKELKAQGINAQATAGMPLSLITMARYSEHGIIHYGIHHSEVVQEPVVIEAD